MYEFNIIVEGNYACFTRPEFKVERLSYEVPTPGAMEGMLKKIYWKPAFRYVIDKIVVFNPVRTMAFTRREVKSKLSLRNVKSKMKDPSKDICIYSDRDGTMRTSVVLKNVKYGISFHIESTGRRCEKEDECIEKHIGVLKKRLKKGRYFNRPYLGCREFSVKKIRMTDYIDYGKVSKEIKSLGKVDLGYMLYHMSFKDDGVPLNDDYDNPVYSDEAEPVYYHPYMINGVINVARYKEAANAD